MRFLLVTRVVPYFLQKNDLVHHPNRSLDDQLVARELSLASKEQLKCRWLDGAEWWFTKKRILGSSRPPISDHEVAYYIALCQSPQWTWKDFQIVLHHAHV